MIFCENAINQLKKSIGKTEVNQVYKKLIELQRVAEEMVCSFERSSIPKATPESQLTLDRFRIDHTFELPDGSSKVFSWHVRFTGSYAGRIFFEAVPEQKKIYVAHIGKKLPTVLYH